MVRSKLVLCSKEYGKIRVKFNVSKTDKIELKVTPDRKPKIAKKKNVKRSLYDKSRRISVAKKYSFPIIISNVDELNLLDDSNKELLFEIMESMPSDVKILLPEWFKDEAFDSDMVYAAPPPTLAQKGK